MNEIIIEKNTGIPVPAGVAIDIAKGGNQSIILKFLTGGLLGLLPDGTPISLALYDPNDTGTPLAIVSAWTPNVAQKLYIGVLDTLAGAIAWVQPKTLIGKVTYGSPGVDSVAFHVRYGIGTAQPGSPLLITNVTVTGMQKTSVPMSPFMGELADEQVFAYYRAQQDIDILGMHLNAQEAPVGADVLVDIVFGASAEQSKVAKLTDGQQAEETIYATPLRALAGQVIRLKIKQVGATTAGSWMTPTLIVQPVSA